MSSLSFDTIYSLSSSSSSERRRYKCSIIGGAGTGKTAFIDRHKTGDFETSYIPTHGIKSSNLRFHTSTGDFVFYISDIGGQGMYDYSEIQEYTKDSDLVIILFDVTNKITYDFAREYYIRAKQIAPNAVFILCGNKVDCKDRKVKSDMIKLHREFNMHYWDISAKSGYNTEKPFLHAIRKLTDNNNVHFVCNNSSEIDRI